MNREWCEEIGEKYKENIIYESYYYSSIIKVPEFVQIYDFNKENYDEINFEGNIISFDKKNIFLGLDNYYVIIYDLNDYIELVKYKINKNLDDIQKIGDDSFAITSNNYENYKIDFFKLI